MLFSFFFVFKNSCKDTDIFLNSLSDERKNAGRILKKMARHCFWGDKRWNRLERGQACFLAFCLLTLRSTRKDHRNGSLAASVRVLQPWSSLGRNSRCRLHHACMDKHRLLELPSSCLPRPDSRVSSCLAPCNRPMAGRRTNIRCWS